MTVYEALINEGKHRPCRPLKPCCEEPCDEPSFWELLPQCRLNWIAFGLAALAIGFALIGLGYINIGTIFGIIAIPPSTLPNPFVNPTYLTQGSLLIAAFLGIIAVTAWIFFKACSDDWKVVILGSLLGASGFSLAAIGLLYSTVAQFVPTPIAATSFDPTWFHIAVSLIIASILGFLFIAYFIYASHCYGCISAKKAVIVSLIFLSGGWAAWLLGRLLWVAVTTFQFSEGGGILPIPAGYVFPSSAFMAFIAVSIINIVLVVALGLYVLGCVADNCFTIFLPLFASAAPLGNWALYRVGLNVLSYVDNVLGGVILPATAPLTQFAYAIGFVSITALVLTFVIANGAGDAYVSSVASAPTLLFAIATYTYVATASSLTGATTPDFVTSILQGIFSGIAITAKLVFFLKCQATCPIPKIIYGLASGTFGWAIIYLYSTYSSDILDFTFPVTNSTTLNIGLSVIVSVAIIAVLYVQFTVFDELVGAVTFANIALLTVGAAGFIGTIAYYQAGTITGLGGLLTAPLNASDIRAATIIYLVYALIALLVPQFFVKCGGVKRQRILVIASLAFGVAAIDFGRAVAFARALAFTTTTTTIPILIGNVDSLDFSPLVYVASTVGSVLVGQAIVWAYPLANIYTAMIAILIGSVASGIATQITFFVDILSNGVLNINTALIGVPWLIFTLAIVALLAFLEVKSLCIPEHCRFLPGLLIFALGIALSGKYAGVSAAFGAAFNGFGTVVTISFLTAFSYTSRLILLNSVIPLTGFFLSLQAFQCTSCLAYFPSSVAYIGVVYVASQFELLSLSQLLAPILTLRAFPFLNLLASFYVYLDLSLTSADATEIAANVAFITQTSVLYTLFLVPAIAASFVFSCSRPVSAATIGTAIAATAVSLGAIGVANAVSGVLSGIVNSVLPSGTLVPIPDITTFISFTQFLTGISSQLALLVVGVLTALFISFDKCCYPSC